MLYSLGQLAFHFAPVGGLILMRVSVLGTTGNNVVARLDCLQQSGVRWILDVQMWKASSVSEYGSAPFGRMCFEMISKSTFVNSPE